MRLLRACAAALPAALALAGCGSSGSRTPNVSSVPLVPGARIVAKARQCDSGANAYCGIQFVVYSRRYRNNDDFINSERRLLHAHGWTGANGDTGEESAADSPGHKLRLTYATEGGDAYGLEWGWIKRAKPIWDALSNSVWEQTGALSMLLEYGSGSS